MVKSLIRKKLDDKILKNARKKKAHVSQNQIVKQNRHQKILLPGVGWKYNNAGNKQCYYNVEVQKRTPCYQSRNVKLSSSCGSKKWNAKGCRKSLKSKGAEILLRKCGSNPDSKACSKWTTTAERLKKKLANIKTL